MEEDSLPVGRYDHAKAAVPSVIAAAIEPQTHLCLLFLICVRCRAISTKQKTANLEEGIMPNHIQKNYMKVGKHFMEASLQQFAK